MATDKDIPTPSTANAGGAGGKPPAPPVASATPPGSPGNDPARADASKATVSHGSPGRRPTVFMFPPDSPQGIEERRLADARRKRDDREAARAVAARMVEPSPLRPTTAPLPGSQTPGVDSGVPPAPGASSETSPEAIPWEPELITDLLSELIDAAEENRVAQYAAMCKGANLLPKLCKEIEGDAYFPKMAKKVLSRCLPRLAAKYLNKTGVSAEFQDEVAVFTAFLLIAWNDRTIAKRFAEYAEKNKKPDEPVKPPTPPVAPPAPPAPEIEKPVTEQTLS